MKKKIGFPKKWSSNTIKNTLNDLLNDLLKDFSRDIPCLKTCITWYFHWTWVNQEDRFRLFSWHLYLILHKKRLFWLFNGFDVDIIKFSLLENLFIQIFVAFEFQLNKKPFFYRFPGFSRYWFCFHLNQPTWKPIRTRFHSVWV